MKSLALIACLIALPAIAAAPAADVSGTWTISGEVSGVGVDETCTFTQATDAKLTGSCDTASGKQDIKGSVADQTATFSHGGTYEGQAFVITFTGKINGDGGMTGTMDVDPFGVSGGFSARKGAPATTPPAPAK
jgi:hypothetical protein